MEYKHLSTSPRTGGRSDERVACFSSSDTGTCVAQEGVAPLLRCAAAVVPWVLQRESERGSAVMLVSWTVLHTAYKAVGGSSSLSTE